ncbi:hypothetical protein HYW17_02610 [Candidatus Uhrbacteria bacterium]|nr:hypothetical protein [Candidatus Uhrbacteria bacterium]
MRKAPFEKNHSRISPEAPGVIEVPGREFASREERRAHKERVGDELAARYLKDTPYEEQTLEEAVRDISGAASEEEVQEMLKSLGITKDKAGRFNLKNPERPDVPGSWEKEDRLKALLVGMAGAKNAGEQLQAIAKAYEYMGLPFKAEYQLSPKEKQAPTVPLSVWRKVLGAGRAAAFGAGLLMLGAPHAARFTDEGGIKPETGALSKGRGRAGEAEGEAEAASEKEDRQRLHTLKPGDRVWDVVADILKAQVKKKVSKADILLAAKAVCEQNGIRDKELGINTGAFDSRHLRPGMTIDVSAADDVVRAISAKS